MLSEAKLVVVVLAVSVVIGFVCLVLPPSSMLMIMSIHLCNVPIQLSATQLLNLQLNLHDDNCIDVYNYEN